MRFIFPTPQKVLLLLFSSPKNFWEQAKTRELLSRWKGKGRFECPLFTPPPVISALYLMYNNSQELFFLNSRGGMVLYLDCPGSSILDLKSIKAESLSPIKRRQVGYKTRQL
jgi:hypothetical protein